MTRTVKYAPAAGPELEGKTEGVDRWQALVYAACAIEEGMPFREILGPLVKEFGDSPPKEDFEGYAVGHLLSVLCPPEAAAMTASSALPPCPDCDRDHPEAAHYDLVEAHRQVVQELAKARRQLTTVESWAGVLLKLALGYREETRGLHNGQ
jgi:hypothetical protein